MKRKAEEKKDESRRIFLVCLLTFLGKCSASEEIKAKCGDDVVLQCQCPNKSVIELLEWSKPDWKSEDYVYYFRDERIYENYQHPSFRGRVELRNQQMKDGDVSVILRNSSVNDTGKYECYVGYEGRFDLITTINLTVTDSGDGAGHTEDGGDKDGNFGLIVGLSAAGLLVVIAVAVGLVIFRKHKSEFTSVSSSVII